MNSSHVLSVRNLDTRFQTQAGEIRAVDDVSFDLQKGEILGLVGESGSGKSVTGFSIMGLVDEPGEIHGGQIKFKGEDLTKASSKRYDGLRGREIAMIFQDPMTSLNPYLRIEDQLIEPLLIHGLADKADAKKQALEMLDAVLDVFHVAKHHRCRGGHVQFVRDGHHLQPVVAHCLERRDAVADLVHQNFTAAAGDGAQPRVPEFPDPVSYTHLTLPTICSV